MLKFSVWLLTYLILSNAVLQNGNTLNLVGIDQKRRRRRNVWLSFIIYKIRDTYCHLFLTYF